MGICNGLCQFCQGCGKEAKNINISIDSHKKGCSFNCSKMKPMDHNTSYVIIFKGCICRNINASQFLMQSCTWCTIFASWCCCSRQGCCPFAWCCSLHRNAWLIWVGYGQRCCCCFAILDVVFCTYCSLYYYDDYYDEKCAKLPRHQTINSAHLYVLTHTQ